MIEVKNNDLLFARIKSDAIIPTKEKENAGYDIYACFEEDFMIIPPHSTKLIPTGIASAMSDKYYLQVHERGSTGKLGMKYSAGVVDSSYRGEIFVAISNINSSEIFISKLSKEELIEKYAVTDECDGSKVIHYGGEFDNAYFDCEILDIEPIIYPYKKAIAQLVVHYVPEMDVKEITYEELKAIPSKRGTGALGASGK